MEKREFARWKTFLYLLLVWCPFFHLGKILAQGFHPGQIYTEIWISGAWPGANLDDTVHPIQTQLKIINKAHSLWAKSRPKIVSFDHLYLSPHALDEGGKQGPALLKWYCRVKGSNVLISFFTVDTVGAGWTWSEMAIEQGSSGWLSSAACQDKNAEEQDTYTDWKRYHWQVIHVV